MYRATDPATNLSARRATPFALSAFLAVMLGATSLIGARPAAAAPTSPETVLIAEIAADINRERTSRGLSALPLDGRLSAQSQLVAEKNRQSCPEDACHGNYPEAEVSAWRLGYASSSATYGWIVSDPHRHLILSPQATSLGVGVACAADGSYHAIAQLLGVLSNTPRTPKSAPVTPEDSGSRCSTPVPAPTTSAPPTTAAAATTVAPTIPATTAATTPATAPATTEAPTTTATAPPTTAAPTTAAAPEAPPTTTAVTTTAAAGRGGTDRLDGAAAAAQRPGDGGASATPLVVGAGVGTALAVALAAFRRRRRATDI